MSRSPSQIERFGFRLEDAMDFCRDGFEVILWGVTGSESPNFHNLSLTSLHHTLLISFSISMFLQTIFMFYFYKIL